jgi:MEDS: MEthanogen/methylotroph, DcmR Sensory domain
VTVDLGIPGLAVEPGSHLCAFYGGDVERDEIMMPVLLDGMKARDRCICLVDRADPGSIVGALEAEPSARPGLESNCLQLVTWDSILASVKFEPDTILDFWERSFEDALAKGWNFIRGMSEMSWGLRDHPGVDKFMIVEAKFNRIAVRYPQVTICLYDLKLFGGKQLISILKTHPQVLVAGVVHENPYYVEPEEFLANGEDDLRG